MDSEQEFRNLAVELSVNAENNVADAIGLLHRDEKGILRDNFSNSRVIVFSCSAYRSMCDALYDQFQSGAGIILYRMGEGYGKKLVKGIPSLGLSREEMLRALEKIAYLAGWGKIVLSVENPKLAEAIVEDSPFKLRRDDIGSVSCHFMSGVLAGGASELFSDEFKVQETKCASKGEHQVCRFKIFAKGSE